MRGGATGRRAFLAGVGAAACGLAGCSARLEAGGETTPVSLLLNWQPGGLHVPYYAAESEGFYGDEGIEIAEIEAGQGSDFSATQVGLDNVEFAITSSDQILNAAAEELASTCVAVVMQRGPVQVFATPEQFGEELTDADQLAGRTLGSGPGMVRQMTESYLEVEGVREEVEYVDSGMDTVQQLLTGEIDAAGGVFSDVVDARHQDYEIDALSVADVIPSYGHVIAVGDEIREEDPETVERFLRATARGAVWANENPEEATDALADAVEELAETWENQRDKWEEMRTGFMLSSTVEEQGWGASEPEPWESVHETLAGGEFEEGDVDPDDVWTNEYLDTDSEYVAEYAERVET